MINKTYFNCQPIIYTFKGQKDRSKIATCPNCLNAGCINCQPLSKIFNESVKKQKHNGLIDLFA